MVRPEDPEGLGDLLGAHIGPAGPDRAVAVGSDPSRAAALAVAPEVVVPPGLVGLRRVIVRGVEMAAFGFPSSFAGQRDFPNRDFPDLRGCWIRNLAVDLPG